MKKRQLTIPAATLCLLAVTPLDASVLFSFSAPFGSHTNFESLQTDGTASALFTLGDGSVSFNGGLTHRTSDNAFFAIGNDWLGNSSLVKFNSTGPSSLTTLAPLGTGFLGGLAYNPDDQLFYAIANDLGGNSSLYSFGEDGVLSAPRPLGVGFYGSLTYNTGNGLLYATATGQGGVQRGLYSIDPAGVGLTTLLFSLGDGSVDFGAGLAWDSDNSQFYALGFDGWNPFSLVTFTLGGANTLTTVGTLPPALYRGLVLLAEDPGGGGNTGGGNTGGGNTGGGDPTPVPEPSTWALLGAGLAALVAYRRRSAPRALLAAILFLPSAASAQFSQPVRDVENPAQSAILRTGSITMPGTVTGSGQTPEPPPLGKRFAIESLGVICEGAKETEMTKATITVRIKPSPNVAAVSAVFPIVMTRQGVDSSFTQAVWVGTLQGRVFHDNPDNLTVGPSISVNRWPGTGTTTCTYAMTGGLTNLPQ